MTENNDKNVYILGAGFSYEAGIPLMSDFLDKARHLWLTKHEEFRGAFEYQAQLLSSSRIMNHNLDNIEELFSLLELDIEINENDPELIAKRKSLVDLICKTIEETDSSKNETWENRVENQIVVPKSAGLHYGYNNDNYREYIYDIYGYFVGLATRCLEEGRYEPDTIITFNYDLVVERALNKYPVRINFGVNELAPNDGKTIKLLKPHGSIGFKAHTCKNILQYDKAEISLNGLPPICKKCEQKILGKEDTSELIVPPTWNKTSYMEDVQKIWSECAKEISTARRIIIIGYSLPETDVFFKHLLGLSLAKNKILDKIIVVDVNKEIDEKYRRLFYDKFHRNYTFFNGGLKRFISKDPDINNPMWRTGKSRQEINEI